MRQQLIGSVVIKICPNAADKIQYRQCCEEPAGSVEQSNSYHVARSISQ